MLSVHLSLQRESRKAERPCANRVQIEQNLLFYYSTSLTSTPIAALTLIGPIRRSDF
jgi:hypothetical protein